MICKIALLEVIKHMCIKEQMSRRDAIFKKLRTNKKQMAKIMFLLKIIIILWEQLVHSNY